MACESQGTQVLEGRGVNSNSEKQGRILFYTLFFEIASYVAQTGLELIMWLRMSLNSSPSCLHLQSRITGMHLVNAALGIRPRALCMQNKHATCIPSPRGRGFRRVESQLNSAGKQALVATRDSGAEAACAKVLHLRA